MAQESYGRRRFLASLALTLVVSACPKTMRTAAASALRGPGRHPAPRPGIDASHVLTRAQLDNADAAKVFDMVREMPQIVDGIGCSCGCADAPGFRSLLSCYEDKGMAQECQVCQGQARLAYDLFRKGRTLDQIRAAIDARFG